MLNSAYSKIIDKGPFIVICCVMPCIISIKLKFIPLQLQQDCGGALYVVLLQLMPPLPLHAVTRVRFCSEYLYSNFCYFIKRQLGSYAITLQKYAIQVEICVAIFQKCGSFCYAIKGKFVPWR